MAFSMEGVVVGVVVYAPHPTLKNVSNDFSVCTCLLIFLLKEQKHFKPSQDHAIFLVPQGQRGGGVDSIPLSILLKIGR